MGTTATPPSNAYLAAEERRKNGEIYHPNAACTHCGTENLGVTLTEGDPLYPSTPDRSLSTLKVILYCNGCHHRAEVEGVYL